MQHLWTLSPTPSTLSTWCAGLSCLLWCYQRVLSVTAIKLSSTLSNVVMHHNV